MPIEPKQRTDTDFIIEQMKNKSPKPTSTEPPGSITEKCPKWRIRLVDLNGNALRLRGSGDDSNLVYELKSPKDKWTLNEQGYTKIYNCPFLTEGQLKSASVGAAKNKEYPILFKNLKLLPNIDTLYSEYPDTGDTKTIGAMIGGNIEQNIKSGNKSWENTCAERASIAFNATGTDQIPFVGEKDHKIPSEKNIPSKYSITENVRIFTEQNKNYIVSAEEFHEYLKAKYPDAPTVVGSKAAGQGTFENKRGVLVFLRSNGNSMHIDMWDKNEIKYNDDEWVDNDTNKIKLVQWVVIKYEKTVIDGDITTYVLRMYPK